MGRDHRCPGIADEYDDDGGGGRYRRRRSGTRQIAMNTVTIHTVAIVPTTHAWAVRRVRYQPSDRACARPNSKSNSPESVTRPIAIASRRIVVANQNRGQRLGVADGLKRQLRRSDSPSSKVIDNASA